MLSLNIPKIISTVLIALTALSAVSVSAPEAEAAVVAERKGPLGIIKGVIRDQNGRPIGDATVAIFRVGTSKLLKQVRSGSDGSFLAKILPGTYTILAVAQGFNPITLSEVEINRSSELVYKFNLERAGSGNTLPEKRVDRNSSKWSIRSAQSRRSIYQNQEGELPVEDDVAEDTAELADDEKSTRPGQTVVQTFTATSEAGSYTGVNFASLLPVSESASVVVAGQTGSSENAPKRFETSFKFRPNSDHQIHINTSVAQIGRVSVDNEEKQLGQFSVQALDEWKVKDGVILVFGFDYSRFMGAGSDFSLSPRLGLQFDVNPRTRVRSSYTTQTEEKSWARALELEGTQVAFSESIAVPDFVIENDKPQMNRSSRLEFGVERILDNNSSIEANVFFDFTAARGVGLMSLPIDFLGEESANEFVANQQGKSQGMRLVYSRRLNGTFSTSAGYAFGSGQRLSEQAVSSPSSVFENDFFQTFFGQFNTSLRTGTQVKTIFRFSPQATVFAIDPFRGRMAIYDPSLSILVTQSLPTLGLPIRAEAVIDARNLFDYQSGISGEEGSLKLTSQKRILRGGIMVRF